MMFHWETGLRTQRLEADSFLRLSCLVLSNGVIIFQLWLHSGDICVHAYESLQERASHCLICCFTEIACVKLWNWWRTMRIQEAKKKNCEGMPIWLRLFNFSISFITATICEWTHKILLNFTQYYITRTILWLWPHALISFNIVL